MTKPDRTSGEVARMILCQLLPDTTIRKTVCRELAGFWQYAKRNYPDKAFITLAQRFIRMNVGMVEVFVIHPNGTVLVVTDRAMVEPNAASHYKSLADAFPIEIWVEEFNQRITELRPAIFSVINKLGATRRHPSAYIGHSPALAELLSADQSGRTLSMSTTFVRLRHLAGQEERPSIRKLI